MDDLWRRSNDLDVHKCIVSISESLLEAKTLLEELGAVTLSLSPFQKTMFTVESMV